MGYCVCWVLGAFFGMIVMYTIFAEDDGKK